MEWSAFVHRCSVLTDTRYVRPMDREGSLSCHTRRDTAPLMLSLVQINRFIKLSYITTNKNVVGFKKNRWICWMLDFALKTIYFPWNINFVCKHGTFDFQSCPKESLNKFKLYYDKQGCWRFQKNSMDMPNVGLLSLSPLKYQIVH